MADVTQHMTRSRKICELESPPGTVAAQVKEATKQGKPPASRSDQGRQRGQGRRAAGGTQGDTGSGGALDKAETLLQANKKRGPPSPNKAPAKPFKAPKKGPCGNREQGQSKAQHTPATAGKASSVADSGMMEVDVQSKSLNTMNIYRTPCLNIGDSEMSDHQAVNKAQAGNGVNDSDIGPGSDEDSEQSEDEGAVSEPDKRLTKIANDPIALSAAFAEERPTWDTDEDHLGDVTIRPDDHTRASSRCSNASISLSQIDLDDSSEGEPIQPRNVKDGKKACVRVPSMTIQQKVQVSEKQTKGHRTKRDEKREKETAKWGDDNKHIEVIKSTQKSSRSRATEFKRESQREVIKFKEESDPSHTTSSQNEDNANGTSDSIDLIYKNGKLLALSITKVQAFITLNNAYPETEGGLADCTYQIIYEAAKFLGYRDVAARLKIDSKYRKGLIHNPKERISSFRTAAKRIFEAAIVGGPGLGNLTHEEWEKIAAGFSYVDPVLPDGKITARDAKRPYEDPLVTQMLQAIYFAKSSCLGTKFEEELPEYDGKRAVSDAMVAFIATGIHAALDTKYMKKPLDISSCMQEVYREHIDTLTTYKERRYKQYTKFMTNLYNVAAKGTEPRSGGGGKFIDFDGMDDSK